MEQHEDVVLEQRVGPWAVEAGRHGGSGRERVGGTEGDQREEGADDEHHDQRPPDEVVVEAPTEAPGDGRRESGEHDHPQQDRALERAPHGGDVVERRRGRRPDLLDVGEREVTHCSARCIANTAISAPARISHA